jgi:hypothetical protein
MTILIWGFIFLLGIAAGSAIRGFLYRRSRTSGTIYVTHGEEKTLYSLELTEYPEKLEFKKQVVFKVEASSESPVRE